MIKALLVYPEFPVSFWSGKYALEFVGRKSAMPPLGLLTVAALFPRHYQLKLVDMNVEPLTESHLEWADYVFCSAMLVQRASFESVVQRCKARKIPLIAGGPYVTSFHEEIADVDYLVLGEVESFFAEFLRDLEAGRAKPVTRAGTNERGEPCRPDLAQTPLPLYGLIDRHMYGSAAIQFSRGCPYNCEFCDITKLFGRVPRTKTNAQILTELDTLYNGGWRQAVFWVDDNFIGNRTRVRELLPLVSAWQKERKYPFSFYTEATANLAEMPDLLEGMVEAGFDMVFLGLESPNPQTLLKARKSHNVKQNDPDYLLKAIRTIQAHGIEVTGGFILGFDQDDESVFDAQFDFIQRSGIASAMLGLLTALKGTDLYDRLKCEGRLLTESIGNNVTASLNFIPAISQERLIAGYKTVLARLYDQGLNNYFERCYTMLCNLQRRRSTHSPYRTNLSAFMKSLRRQLFSRQGPAYLKFLTKVLVTRPVMFAEAVRLAIMGYHFERVARQTAAE